MKKHQIADLTLIHNLKYGMLEFINKVNFQCRVNSKEDNICPVNINLSIILLNTKAQLSVCVSSILLKICRNAYFECNGQN